MTTDGISPRQFQESTGVEDWRVLGDGAFAFFATGSLEESAGFVQAIGRLEAIDDHPPAIDIRPGGVTLKVVTLADDWAGVTERDVELARRISLVARDLGLAADPSAVQHLLVVPGAPDTAAILPFWQAILGYEPRPDSPDEDLVDPRRRDVSFWFEQMREARPGGTGAIHLAVWVPAEQAEARVAAALAAGGRMVRDANAPDWWTLADAAGNEVDVSTALGRG